MALSEFHEAVFADHLTRLFGVEWETRDRGRDRNAAWAIAKVPEQLVSEFSSRYGTQPSSTTISKLRAQATLATRPDKEIHSLAELTTQWRRRAGEILGSDATRWAREITVNAASLLLRADDVPLDVIRGLGRSVVVTVGKTLPVVGGGASNRM